MPDQFMRELGSYMGAAQRIPLGADASLQSLLEAAAGELLENLKRLRFTLSSGAAGNMTVDNSPASSSSLELVSGWLPSDYDHAVLIRVCGTGYLNVLQIV